MRELIFPHTSASIPHTTGVTFDPIYRAGTRYTLTQDATSASLFSDKSALIKTPTYMFAETLGSSSLWPSIIHLKSARQCLKLTSSIFILAAVSERRGTRAFISEDSS